MKHFVTKTKKNISILLITCMVLNIAGNFVPVKTLHAATVTTSAEGVEGFKSLLATLFKTGDNKIYDVSKYRITFNEMVNAYFSTAKQEAVAYYTYYGLRYTYTLNSNGYVSTFRLNNYDSTFKTRYAKMQKEVDLVLSGMDTNMTDLEKVVYIHDYLAYHAQYDKSDPIPTPSYWAYGVIVNKTGVCDSYTKAFMMFMWLFGISCNYVYSGEMEHSWVLVKVGNYYYHLDPTWDDPTPDTPGRVFHEFMLRTDEEFKNGLRRNHSGWSSFVTAKDTTFSNWEIHKVRSRILYHNGDWYFVDSTNSIVKSDIKCTDKSTIVAGGKTYGKAIYTVEEFNGGLLYTQGNKIMYCDYNGNNKIQVLQLNPSTAGTQNTIDYLHISDDDVLTCTVYNFTDANDDDSYINKNVYTYDLSYIQECINTGENPSNGNNTSDDDTSNETPVTDPSQSETYTKLEYIEIDTNKNSIDTNYFANNNTSISLDMAITSSDIYGNYINGYDNSCNRLIFRQESSKGLYVAYGWYNSSVYNPTVYEKFNISQLGALTYINEKLVRTATKQTYQMTNSLKIGTAKSRIYECKIWDGNNLVRDLIPVLDENGTPCLYDLVDNLFYYGKSECLAGPKTEDPSEETTLPTDTETTTDTETPTEIEPDSETTPAEENQPEEPTDEYTVASYIEIASGNNKIDTGLLANSNTSISLDMAITDSNIYSNYIYGFDNSSNRLIFRQEATAGLYVAYGWYNSCIYKPSLQEKFNITQKGALTYINDNLVRTATKQTYQMTTSLKIGTAKCRIYGCKIWDGEELIREYIPVVDSQGAACLYDKISKEFYYGTGTINYSY